MEHFDVIVVGGGHAGAEAAHAAARVGAKTALVTMDATKIGVMSCNPAIGGLGKGHLVREIDALDGVMGRVADRAGIQFRLLNRSKGPAVQGPRTQADRKLYRLAIQQELRAISNLSILESEVADLLHEAGRVAGVVLIDGTVLRSNSVILTSGTFLRGIIHIGDSQRSGGRIGDPASVRLAERLKEFSLPLGRLKTGTPPRLDGRTIDWARLEQQDGDQDTVFLSFLSSKPTARQVSCGITHTNAQTHAIIRENIERSAMYGGHIEGIGPRYCPSIEDKVVRFADKLSHQVFLEPEGLDDPTVYPNGISTSLPSDVQEAYVRSIVGLESAVITQLGYAIEYDYVDPQALRPSLEVRSVPGLFLAGQINGTTGYEEAAAQGLVAGLNAARKAKEMDPVIFSRSESYIGVMIDDLVTRGVSEPYRMFTSRAEFRLSLRADNADQRLTPLGIRLGCVGEDRAVAFARKMEALESARQTLLNLSLSPQEASAAGLKVNHDGIRRNGLDLLAFPGVTFEDMRALVPHLDEVSAEAAEQISRDALYASFVDRQRRDVEGIRRDEFVVIPDDFCYIGLQGLSHELQGKLQQVRPRDLAQAGRIEGMTPAAMTLILARVRSHGRSRIVG